MVVVLRESCFIFCSLEREFPNFKFPNSSASEPMEEDNQCLKKDIDAAGDGFVGLYTK
jgi:hypothetical protein